MKAGYGCRNNQPTGVGPGPSGGSDPLQGENPKDEAPQVASKSCRFWLTAGAEWGKRIPRRGPDAERTIRVGGATEKRLGAASSKEDAAPIFANAFAVADKLTLDRHNK